MKNNLDDHYRQVSWEHLNQIILTQSRLAEANFNLDDFMQLVVEQVQNLTRSIGVVVELVDGDDMVYRAATGTVKTHVGLHLPQKNSISGLCVREKKILRSDDTETDKRVNIEACRRVHARSLVVAPLFYKGDTVGVLKILSDKPSAFTEDDVKTLQLMAGLIGSALAHQISHDTTERLLEERTRALEEVRKAEEKLTHMANYDYLTNLPNRNLFHDRLNVAINHAKRSKKKLALFFLDIDHFKLINDKLGHDVGDEILKTFAARIQQCIRKSDTPARLGGDEFVILLDQINDFEVASVIAQKIIANINTPFTFQEKSIHVSTSIGITFFKDDNTTPTELLKQADQALYAAKKAGRNNYKIFAEM